MQGRDGLQWDTGSSPTGQHHTRNNTQRKLSVRPAALPVDHVEVTVALDARVVRRTSGTSTDLTRVALGPHGRLVAT